MKSALVARNRKNDEDASRSIADISDDASGSKVDRELQVLVQFFIDPETSLSQTPDRSLECVRSAGVFKVRRLMAASINSLQAGAIRMPSCIVLCDGNVEIKRRDCSVQNKYIIVFFCKVLVLLVRDRCSEIKQFSNSEKLIGMFFSISL